MLLLLKTVNVMAILLMLFMLAVILKQQPSKVQTAFILYDVFTILFVIGIHLELIHSNTVGEALSGLCVQYVGQVGLLPSLLWFVSEFVRFPISKWAYRLEAACGALVLAGVFTAEKHRFFYSSMKILTDGMYHRIEVGTGILWSLHFINLYAVVLTILVLCAVRYRESTPVQKKRIVYIAAGIGALAAMLLLKIGGMFGSYNPIVIAMTFCMFCMMMAIVRYSYFDSLHAAVDNAFNHGNEGLIILDNENAVVFMNHRIRELFSDLKRGSTIDSYQELKKLAEGEEHLLRRDGIVYELRMEDIIELGEKNGRMLWFVDQTQQLMAMQKLREADEAKTQFLMNVSHELRTPMNTMLSMNEMILRESGKEEIINYAREVASAGAHMMSLIDEILDASRLKSGMLTVSTAPYRITGMLEKVEELMRPQAEYKGLSFLLRAEDELTEPERVLLGDEMRIRQILLNLLSNAVKYTDSGFVRLEAKTQEISGKRCILFSVSDSGIGIPREEQRRIFESFGRGSNVGSRDGIGLGLAIARQLAEAMEGTFSVESAPGKGSVFTVSLPWAEAPEESLLEWKEKEPGKKDVLPKEGDAGLTDLHTRTILAVDDNERNLLVLKHLLKRTKAMVETAADGREAVQICARKKYDLILLDHMMPGMDGIAAFHAIRRDQDGKNRDTKVIALTANAGREAKRRYLSEGFTDYLSKPIDPEELEKMLVCYLQGDGSEDKDRQKCGKKMVSAGKGWQDLLSKNGICIREGLRYADQDEAFYQKLLVLFAQQQEEERQELEDIRKALVKWRGSLESGGGEPEAKEPWYAFVSFCHGRKGEAKGLGASALGDYFYQLELAGRARDREKILDIYPHAVEEWVWVADIIRTAGFSSSFPRTPEPPSASAGESGQ